MKIRPLRAHPLLLAHGVSFDGASLQVQRRTIMISCDMTLKIVG
jgi:hypothetical protein